MDLTYERLFELLRIEKNRPELQELPADFVASCARCIHLATQHVKGVAATTESVHQHIDRSLVQLDSIKRMIKEIYDRREKKIMDMAINVSRTGTRVKADLLLSHEKELFDALCGNLLHYRKGSVQDILQGKIDPALLEALPAEQPVLDESEDEDEQLPAAVHALAPVIEPPSPFFNEEGMSQVRIVQALDQVVGPDLNIYGPYEKDSVVGLPSVLAQVLISKGQAQSLD